MEKFQAEAGGGSLYARSPETVAAKVAAVIRLLGLSRFDLAYVPRHVTSSYSGLETGVDLVS
jgi:hypothetical protein